jgi:DNA polymerase
MINIAELTWPRKGQMPIPLKIGAAHTHRLGGDWKLNPQNWGRASLIRKAMRAPAGHKVVVGDSEQIEARITAWFCEQWDLVEQFRKGEDVYANFASDIFGYKVNKVDHPGPRFVGKTGILQLGFQCAHIKFRNTVWLLSYKYEKEAIDLSEQEASRIVEGFRNRFGKIKGMWDRLKNVIAFMCQRSIDAEQFMEIGPIRFGRERMIGPNGLQMNYHNLRYDHASMQWLYEYGDVTHKLYGGKLLENIVQFLARIAVMQAAVNLRKKLLTYSCRFVHTSHDELVYIVLDKDVEAVKATLKEEMGRTPAWAPGLPLRASVDSGDTYGDAK